MNEKLTLEGERYIGRFSADIKSEISSYGQDELEYWAKWYEGAGIIEDKKTKEEHFLLFKTESFGEYNEDYSLEEACINFDKKLRHYENALSDKSFKLEIADTDSYKKMIDLILLDAIHQIQFSTEQVPMIIPRKLRPNFLLEKGFCIKKEL